MPNAPTCAKAREEDNPADSQQLTLRRLKSNRVKCKEGQQSLQAFMTLTGVSEPLADIDEDKLEVHKPKTEAAGVKAVIVALERAVAQAGVARTHSRCCPLNQRRLQLPGPRLAGIGQEAQAALFCENGAKGVAEEYTCAQWGLNSGRNNSICGAFHQVGVLAGQPRPAFRAGGYPGNVDVLLADFLGRCVRADRRPYPGHHPGPVRLLYLRPRRERDRIPLPAVRTVHRHEQPAGLLQHVSRVLRIRAEPAHRDRPGHDVPG